MKVRAFITHKKAERYSDCQDRFSISDDGLVIALSDGMTSNTLYPDIWADLLTKAYVEARGKWSDDVLESCKRQWNSEILKKLQEKTEKGDRNVWRLANNIAENKSAGATLCGICIDVDAKWIGYVIGDSTIIKCKNKEIEEICTSEDKPFDNYPDYLDSISVGRGKIKDFNGIIDENNFLLLVSDPFSEFLSVHKEESIQYIEEILALESHEDFVKLVDKWRTQGMHNDDSTLIIVQSDTDNIIKKDDIRELIRKEIENVQNSLINPTEVLTKETFTIEENESLLEKKNDFSDCLVERYLKKILDKICSTLGKKTKKDKDKLSEKIRELLYNFLNEYDNTSRPS